MLEVDWVVSHFQPQPVKNGTLAWQLLGEGKPLAGGKIEGVDVSAGDVRVVGRSRIVIPEMSKPVKADLVVALEPVHSSNSWNMWIFPRFRPCPEAARDLAATPGALDLLVKRYPGIGRLGSPEAAAAKLLVARDLGERGVIEALKQGKRVLCLSLPGYNLLQPGVHLGWWQVSNQTGTAIAAHPAFGDFPHDGSLDQGWFRLVDRAEKLDPGHKFRNVEPLMIGIGRETGYNYGTLGYPLGFNLHVFQAQVGGGKLLASGLKLSSENPEAVYLLDQFIRYAASPQFRPTGRLDSAALEEQAKKPQELQRLERDRQGERDDPVAHVPADRDHVRRSPVEGAGERGVEDGPLESEREGHGDVSLDRQPRLADSAGRRQVHIAPRQ